MTANYSQWDVALGASAAFELVEALDEPWVYEAAIDSLPESTLSVVETCQGDTLLYDRGHERRWLESDHAVDVPR